MLRAAQCREGWHRDHEPIVQADEPDDEQRLWIELRAQAQQERDQADPAAYDYQRAARDARHASGGTRPHVIEL